MRLFMCMFLIPGKGMGIIEDIDIRHGTHHRFPACRQYCFWLISLHWCSLGRSKLHIELCRATVTFTFTYTISSTLLTTVVIPGRAKNTCCPFKLSPSHSASHQWCAISLTLVLRNKATIHQVTTVTATSKIVLFPGHNHLANHWYWWPFTLIIILAGICAIIKVSGHQYRWLVSWLCPGNRTFLEVAIMVVTWWIVACLPSAYLPVQLLSKLCLSVFMYIVVMSHMEINIYTYTLTPLNSLTAATHAKTIYGSFYIISKVVISNKASKINRMHVLYPL